HRIDPDVVGNIVAGLGAELEEMLILRFPSRIALGKSFDGFGRAAAGQHPAPFDIGAGPPFAEAIDMDAAVLGEQIQTKRVAPRKQGHLVVQSGLSWKGEVVMVKGPVLKAV